MFIGRPRGTAFFFFSLSLSTLLVKNEGKLGKQASRYKHVDCEQTNSGKCGGQCSDISDHRRREE